VTTGSQDPAGAGRDRLRAGHADREQVIKALKTAFVDGRLTKAEFAERTGRTLTARTYADLAALTADLPAELVTAAAAPAAVAPAAPAQEIRRPMTWAAAIAVFCVVIGAGALLGAGHLDSDPYSPHGILIGELLSLAAILFGTALSALGIGAVVSIEQRRSRKQTPPRAGQLPPGPGGRALDGGQPGGTGHDPVPPGHRADETQTDLQARKSHQRGRRVPAQAGRALGGVRPAPGAA